MQKKLSKDVCRNPKQFGQISKVLFKTSLVSKNLLKIIKQRQSQQQSKSK